MIVLTFWRNMLSGYCKRTFLCHILMHQDIFVSVIPCIHTYYIDCVSLQDLWTIHAFCISFQNAMSLFQTEIWLRILLSWLITWRIAPLLWCHNNNAITTYHVNNDPSNIIVLTIWNKICKIKPFICEHVEPFDMSSDPHQPVVTIATNKWDIHGVGVHYIVFHKLTMNIGIHWWHFIDIG